MLPRMKTRHVPESTHCCYDAIELGDRPCEVGYLAYAHPDDPRAPLRLAPVRESARTGAPFAHCGAGPFPEAALVFWFPDRADPTLLGPYARHEKAGVAVPAPDGTRPESWEACLPWLLAREAELSRSALDAHTPAPLEAAKSRSRAL